MRASLSVVLNLAEGSGRTGKDKLNRYAIAESSAREAMEAIETAIGWGLVSEEQGRPVLHLFDRAVAMMVRLRFPKRG